VMVLDIKMDTDLLNEAEVVADVARERETPVAFTNVLPARIEEELASQDIPMMLNATPGVYATQTGGGDGDSRITIRGFDQRNVAVMLDGIPVNDMENGWVYWSNWFGLDIVTRSIQIQRGLGASKIAIPSVGGTMNILSKGIEAKKGVTIKQEVANNAFFRTSIGLTSGRLKNGWGFTLAGSFKTGDGWVDKTFTEGYFYYLKAEKQAGKHLLSLSVMGAPQKHGQRTFKTPIAAWDKDYAREQGVADSVIALYTERGLRFNEHWGVYEEREYLPLQDGQTSNSFNPGDNITLVERMNYYHKPLFALRDFWSVNEKLYISNVAYVSIGRGGGTGLNSTSSIQYTEQGQIDFQQIYDNNRLFEFGPGGLNLDADGEAKSSTIIRTSINNHMWYGLLSSATYKRNDYWTYSGGLDLRSYVGEHYREVYDLIGGDYFLDSDNLNQRADTKLRVGDKMDYYDEGHVTWTGAFGQAEFKKGLWSAFVNLSGAYSFYKAVDYFRPKVIELADTTLEIGYNTQTEYNGQSFNRDSEGLKTYETDWVKLFGFTAKGGANYNINEWMNAFVNIGYLSRAPRFDNVISINNEINDDYENELINGYELGMSYTRKKWASNLNAYYTIWGNRPVNQSIRLDHPLEPGTEASVFIPSIDALHMGVEWDFAYVISPSFKFEGLATISDWTWQSEEEGDVVDQDGTLIINPETNEPFTVAFDPKGVHVGDAAQLQFAGSLRYEYKKNFYLTARSTYFDKYYANFNPEDLVGPNAGRDSWQIPGYNQLELHTGYKYKLEKTLLSLRFSVFNVLNTKFITDAQNNDEFAAFPLSNFDAASATVFFGQLRRYNVSLTISF
jgi:iron complex outermembrane receptor protein